MRPEQLEEVESIASNLLVSCPGRQSTDIQRCRRLSTWFIVPVVLLHFDLLIWFARAERVIIIWLEQYSVQKVDTTNDLVDLA